MFKNLKIGVCILAFSMLAFIPTSYAVSGWPVFHNGNTLIKGKLNVTDQIVFTGGRTVMKDIMPGQIHLRDGQSPVKSITVGGTGNVWQVLQFDADGGSTGDDHIYFPWVVPDGYVADSGRMNIFWSCESTEALNDTVTFDMTVHPVGQSETVDATPTAFIAVNDTDWPGVADSRRRTQLNFEVVTISVDDVVYFDVFVDESTSAFTDTIDFHAIQIECESTE